MHLQISGQKGEGLSLKKHKHTTVHHVKFIFSIRFKMYLKLNRRMLEFLVWFFYIICNFWKPFPRVYILFLYLCELNISLLLKVFFGLQWVCPVWLVFYQNVCPCFLKLDVSGSGHVGLNQDSNPQPTLLEWKLWLLWPYSFSSLSAQQCTWYCIYLKTLYSAFTLLTCREQFEFGYHFPSRQKDYNTWALFFTTCSIFLLFLDDIMRAFKKYES